MDTYIVRVYRRPEGQGQSYLGVVEFTDGTPYRLFRTNDELMGIIAAARGRGDVQIHYVREE